MSVAGAGFVPLVEATIDPLGEEGPVDGREGVTDGVTFNGRAADDGGGMSVSARGVPYDRERRLDYHIQLQSQNCKCTAYDPVYSLKLLLSSLGNEGRDDDVLVSKTCLEYYGLEMASANKPQAPKQQRSNRRWAGSCRLHITVVYNRQAIV